MLVSPRTAIQPPSRPAHRTFYFSFLPLSTSTILAARFSLLEREIGLLEGETCGQKYLPVMVRLTTELMLSVHA